MKTLFFLLLANLFFFSCGVKAPPLAPEPDSEPTPVQSNSPSSKN